MDPLVSIIMPVYNDEHYIGDAIRSVLNQTYKNWELVVVNDGSTDGTQEIIDSFRDSRIRSFVKENEGVCRARNLALSKMRGDFFCFLDSDDMLTPKSINIRINVLIKDDKIDFVDGIVVNTSADLTKKISCWKPSYRGNPIKQLAKLKDNCFFGITWMIRRNKSYAYTFEPRLNHGEDLIFYLECCRNSLGDYTYVSEQIYIRRIVVGSAMQDIDGLAKGYKFIYDYISTNKLISYLERIGVQFKIKKILALSFLKRGDITKALLALVGISYLVDNGLSFKK